MMFWLICGLTGLVVASVLLLPLLRPSQQVTGREADLAVYRDQLTALDAEVARGAIAPEEAETSRIELSRRLIAAGAAIEEARGDAPARADRIAVLSVALFVLVGGAGIYTLYGSPGRPDAPLAPRIAEAEAMRAATQRPPQAVVEAMLAAQRPAPEMSERDAALINQLVAVVAARPEDLEGRRLLARSYMQLGHYLEGKQIQQDIVVLSGDNASAEDLSAFAEYMIVAAGGYISPEAEFILDRALTLNPTDPWARYYLARTRAQAEEMDAARQIFQALELDPLTPDDLRDAVRDDLAVLNNSGTAPGPSAEDIEAAAQMDAAAQREMIEGMVAGLSARLSTDGGSASEWARLIRAYDVLGQPEQADAAYAQARDIFAGDDAALSTIGTR